MPVGYQPVAEGNLKCTDREEKPEQAADCCFAARGDDHAQREKQIVVLLDGKAPCVRDER